MGTSKTLKDFYEKNDWLSDITYGPNMNNATSPDDDIRDAREELKQNFRLLLFTIPGEINTDLQRGIGIQQFLFEFNSGATQSQIFTLFLEMCFCAPTDCSECRISMSWVLCAFLHQHRWCYA